MLELQDREFERENKERQEELDLELQNAIRIEQEKEEKEFNYNQCVYNALNDYQRYWWSECQVAGWSLNSEEETCTLPQYNADTVTAQKDKSLDRCIQLYK